MPVGKIILAEEDAAGSENCGGSFSTAELVASFFRRKSRILPRKSIALSQFASPYCESARGWKLALVRHFLFVCYFSRKAAVRIGPAEPRCGRTPEEFKLFIFRNAKNLAA
jgi:hypothetical protein